MSDNAKLSSEQALDDYFFGLLDDSLLPEDDSAGVLDSQDDLSVFAEEHDGQALLSDSAVEQAELQSGSESDDAVSHSEKIQSHQPFDFNRLDESGRDNASVNSFTEGGEPPSLRAMATQLPSTAAPVSFSAEPELSVPEVRFTPPRSRTDLEQLQRLLDQMSEMQEEVIIESEAWIAEQQQLAELEKQQTDDIQPALLDDPGWFEDDSTQTQTSAPEPLQKSLTESAQTFAENSAPYAEPESSVQLMQMLPKVAEAPVVSETAEPVAELETSSQPQDEIVATEPAQDILDQEASAQDRVSEVVAEPPPPLWTLPDASEQTEFQALFFVVNGVTFAVPLTELGGIHQLGELNHLIGRPDWYLGLQPVQNRKLDVVDTARWVMPESIRNDDHQENYRYVVMLGESKWGLACDQLHGTETLTKQSVRWREKAGKRPWLAGMVKEKMCALIHVNELISMLKAGLDVKSVL
ncbi:chemotaxis protein CheW [Photobacterium sp. TLY01]|uniref:chemotaxis protein CheW n=1 Tax=Photobacterium sp. TLY01 TaxID=2907534 RepID=UPI001F2D927F|nr:chemotaxis protein CheW [Photobacterium sp. TLY01]UIP28732.1 chemotaxis protein CheW [Photobacterium sp. TLY01]